MTNTASPVDLVVDTSAVLAILLPEAEGPQFYNRLRAAHCPALSAANKLETLMVLLSRQPESAEALFAKLQHSLALRILEVDDAIADQAIAAFIRYGKSRHPAGLNFGDCFSYALAKHFNAPLLYKGNDFAQTDIPGAVP
ncbi:MAG: type II toxin-antitoxin system VapC family toxin [Gammaproteobacteria bacterium]|nr:type II toxin-antitoxin system VapC family toxin [Gammaproteobacteria bacterium]